MTSNVNKYYLIQLIENIVYIKLNNKNYEIKFE